MLQLRTVVIRFVLLLVVGSGAARAEAEVWRQRLQTVDGLPLVSVWAGDRGPWRFAIDTGAEGSSVSHLLAERLALPAVGVVDDHTMTGARRVAVVQVAGLRLGHDGPALSTLLAAVVDVDQLRPSAGTIDGVLGGDALAGFDYALDFAAHQLTLARGETLPRGSRRDGLVLSLRFERRRPIVDWPRDRHTAPLMLVLDTGSDALIVDRGEADSFPCRPRSELAMRLETHAGSHEVQSCEVASLADGALDVSGLRLVAVTWPTAMTRLDRGLLPASAFGRVEVSARDRTLTIWPR